MSLERLSFPRGKIKILLLEGIHDSAVQAFKSSGYASVDLISGALSENELLKVIPDVHILGIRSRTQLSAPVLQAAKHLMTVGCFCIGTNQVDLKAAQQAGIPVFNAPFSNTRSVAELVIAHMIYLMRDIASKNAAAHSGKWIKSAANSYEVRGKTLGIVGYGRIGTQVGIMAESLGMQVFFYDPVRQLPLGNAQAITSLPELLKKSDVVTLHVPGNGTTRNLIGKKEIACMKPSAKLINLSRGKVVDIDAVVAALESEHLGGAAIDVFPEEPSSNDAPFTSPLQKFDNVILTPHIGGSTLEAQANIGEEVAHKLIGFSDSGSTPMAVNFPSVDLPPQQDKHRLLHIHHNRPGVISALNDLLSSHSANIAAQYLQTGDSIGYVVIDIDPSEAILDLAALKKIPGTIKVRILY
jgi:D-3-phosphoglycerate dehydrogenase